MYLKPLAIVAFLLDLVGAARFILPEMAPDGENETRHVLLDEEQSLQSINAIAHDDFDNFSLGYMTGEMYDPMLAVNEERIPTFQAVDYDKGLASQARTSLQTGVVSNDKKSYLVNGGLYIARPVEVNQAVRIALQALGSADSIDAIHNYIRLELQLYIPKRWIVAIFSKSDSCRISHKSSIDCDVSSVSGKASRVRGKSTPPDTFSLPRTPSRTTPNDLAGTTIDSRNHIRGPNCFGINNGHPGTSSTPLSPTEQKFLENSLVREQQADDMQCNATERVLGMLFKMMKLMLKQSKEIREKCLSRIQENQDGADVHKAAEQALGDWSKQNESILGLSRKIGEEWLKQSESMRWDRIRREADFRHHICGSVPRNSPNDSLGQIFENIAEYAPSEHKDGTHNFASENDSETKSTAKSTPKTINTETSRFHGSQEASSDSTLLNAEEDHTNNILSGGSGGTFAPCGVTPSLHSGRAASGIESYNATSSTSSTVPSVATTPSTCGVTPSTGFAPVAALPPFAPLGNYNDLSYGDNVLVDGALAVFLRTSRSGLVVQYLDGTIATVPLTANIQVCRWE